MPTTHRTIRVPDEIWLPAKVKAQHEGVDMTSLIRDFLTRYADDE